MQRAIGEEQFGLVYQPIVSLSEGRVRGVEALLRWNHPQLGLLVPPDFLIAIETTPVMHEVTAMVLRLACRDLARMRQEDWTVSVNIAVTDAVHPRLVDDVQTALDRARLPADRLVLEVTETGVLTEHAAACDVLTAVRDVGAGISLDDFGTGYSSLHYLRELPVTELKVDGLFVADVESNIRDARIVNIMVRLAESFDVHVVAESVERPSQAAFLRQIGCSSAQGYLWGRPGRISDTLEAVSIDVAEDMTFMIADRLTRLVELDMSDTTIAAVLNREGLATPQGRRWHAVSVARAKQELLRESAQ